MDRENLCLSSKTIDIAETDTYLELTNRVCYYDAPNLNKVELSSEEALEKAKTLVDMPVVAKYTTNAKGEPTFKGHEVYIDEDGDVAFGTDNIGTHTKVYIEDDTINVNGKEITLPCLFAKYRIWKRNKNVVSAVQRLYGEGKLYSSWEISTLAYEFKNGIKKLTEYSFLSNCLLGYENAFPAYGVDAKAISMAELSPELLIAEAFAQDKLVESEDDELNKKIKDDVEVVSENKVEETVVVKTEKSDVEKDDVITEVSALTDYDLRRKLNKACREKMSNEWCWVSFIFPEEHVVWAEYDGRESELDYKMFTYTVEGDVVTVSEPTDVKLTVSVSEVNSNIAELQGKVETLNNSLVEASNSIQGLNTQISELNVYKEKFEEAEQLKIAEELAQKQNDLKIYAAKSGFITDEEIES